MTVVGSLAGLAASLGLVVLSALYVRQRRHIQRLRHWASHAAAPSGHTESRQRPPATRARSATPGHRMRLAAAATAAGVALLVAGVLTSAPKDRTAAHLAVPSKTSHARRVDDLADLSRRRRGRTPVAVLNASSIGGLAERTATRLRSLGFAKDVVTNASGPPITVAVVAYVDADGSGPARAIARLLRVGRPVRADATQRRIAQHAEVIVTIGSTPTG